MKQIWIAGLLILAALIAIGGCRTESERLADMADHTVEMQSQQNNSIAKANEEFAKLGRDIQSERKDLNRGFTKLDDERREFQQEKRSGLVWAESFRFLAIVIAATMPLFLCAYLIWATTRKTIDPGLVNEILIRELVSKSPRLIAGPNHPAIEDRSGETPTNKNLSRNT